LEKDPRRRLTWPHLLEHPFLENKVLLPPEKRTFKYNIPYLVKVTNFTDSSSPFSSETSASLNDCLDGLAGASQRDSKTRSISKDAIQKQVKNDRSSNIIQSFTSLVLFDCCATYQRVFTRALQRLEEYERRRNSAPVSQPKQVLAHPAAAFHSTQYNPYVIH
jgi:hypothetical protein